jgi:ferredoxin-NADP reductase
VTVSGAPAGDSTRGANPMNDASVSALSLPLVERHEVAERTFAFQFPKPRDWTFQPGQYTELTLTSVKETDAKGNVRPFSIASAPHEERIMIATRVRDSAFKRGLAELPLGTTIEFKEPSGNFVLHRNPKRAAVILAGGIGVTPFRSIVVDAAHRKLPQKIVMFYSNRRPEDAPFLDELRALESRSPNFKLVATMTQMDKSHRRWDGNVGKVTAELLRRHTGGLESPIYYLAGPPGMVKGLRQILEQWGADPDDIRTEEFDGY